MHEISSWQGPRRILSEVDDDIVAIMGGCGFISIGCIYYSSWDDYCDVVIVMLCVIFCGEFDTCEFEFESYSGVVLGSRFQKVMTHCMYRTIISPFG